VVEVQLSDRYQSGVDWSALGLQGLGYSFTQSLISGTGTLTNTTNPFFSVEYKNPNAASGGSISSTVKLLDQFGNTRVLSSPRIMAINNQTAVLKVVDNLVYFTIQASTTAAANTAAVTTFSTTVNSVPVGFIMSVVPQISESDTVLLNIRPTISRKLRDVPDPNPSLANPCGVPVPVTGCNIPAIASLIPEIQTREMESVMRVQSGQTAVLGGLIQDSVTNIEDTIPGVRSVPGVGQLLAQRKDLNNKTELVIFLRSTVIREASMDGDYSRLRGLQPGADYFLTPNPSRGEQGQ
jgi:MSHA biogenesis protein MshL